MKDHRLPATGLALWDREQTTQEFGWPHLLVAHATPDTKAMERNGGSELPFTGLLGVQMEADKRPPAEPLGQIGCSEALLFGYFLLSQQECEAGDAHFAKRSYAATKVTAGRARPARFHAGPQT